MNKLSYLAVMTLSVFTTLLSLCTTTQAIVHESWSQRYFSLNREDDVPCGVATDSLGNIYVAGQFGHSGSDLDYTLMKLSPNGVQQWIAYYNGEGNGYDHATDFIRDQAGNFYFTGTSYGNNNEEFATVKFNSQGQLQWVAQYPHQDWLGYSTAAMNMDHEGNIYVTGTLYEGTQGFNIVTIKYNTSGVQQWATQFNSPGNLDDYAGKVVVDDQGNVYIAGYCDFGYPNFDFITIKYDPQGVQEWVSQYDGPGHATDIASSLNLDSQGNIYITGTSMGTSATGYDIAILKYDSAGALQWLARYDTPNHADDHASDLKIDAHGDLILAGWMDGSGINAAYVTLKYSPEGVEQWSRIYYQGGVSGDMSGTRTLLVDANQNIYVTGSVSVPQTWTISECLTLKYDSDGNQKWTARHIDDETSYGGGTWGSCLAMDRQNNLIVAGEFGFGGEILDDDFWVAKYQQTEGDLSVTMIPAVSPIRIPAQGGSFSYNDQTNNPVVNNLRVDNWWKVIYPNQTTTRIVGPVQDILQFGNQSTERSQRVPGSAPAGVYQYVMNIGEYPGVIWAVDTLSLTKLSGGNGAGVDDWGISKENGGTRSVVSSSPRQFTLLGVSPNPFNPTTTIRFTLPEAARVSLEVFDIDGRVVRAMHASPLQAGEHEVTFDGSGLAAGVYIYRLTTENATVSGKMVLMK